MILDVISQLDKILILGFAREGQSTYNFLHKRFPHLQIDTADKQNGENYLQNLINYKLIIKTPGISPHLPEIVEAKKHGVLFTSHTQLFFELCPAPIIGVTGTKGKSTTASLIHHVIPNSHLVGNIGKPALDYLDEIKPTDWAVMELSSYQLMDLQKSPHIAVLLHISTDHLDYHLTLEEYQRAKLNITKFQTPNDYLITVDDYPTQAKKIFITPEPVESNLLGQHNLYNIQPAIIIGELLKIPKADILKSIKTFVPLDTRLTNVATINGITFYEDTLATIPEATIAAIDALSGLHSGVKTLICGGHDRKQNYSNLAKKILDSGITTFVLFPETGERIWQEVSSQYLSLNPPPNLGGGHYGGGIKHFFATSMSDAVNFAFQNTPKDGIILLSPAAPSFTLFKDYRDESAQYRAAIANLIS